jgi:hypothetical protein
MVHRTIPLHACMVVSRMRTIIILFSRSPVSFTSLGCFLISESVWSRKLIYVIEALAFTVHLVLGKFWYGKSSKKLIIRRE